ncbi:hypothetical protein LJC32_06340, partial [Oscillospiraceae bacterium OttesenSCG-928-F05]|nr:hypothetical protein [Oscillospiraceae bacterium OttesenSCG-928-F05]
DIPVSDHICPFCGTVQKPYTKVEGKRGGGRGATRLSLTIGILAFIGITATIIGLWMAPRVEETRRQNLIDSIYTAYTNQNAASLDLLVSRYMTTYPGTEEEQTFIDMVYEISGMVPSGTTPAPTESPVNPEDEQKAWLLENVADKVVWVSGLSVSAPLGSAGDCDLSVTFENRTGGTLKEAIFEIQAIDAEGNPAPSSQTGDAAVAARVTEEVGPGETSSQLWLYAWSNPKIAGAEIISARFTYTDGTVIRMDSEVCELIYAH